MHPMRSPFGITPHAMNASTATMPVDGPGSLGRSERPRPQRQACDRCARRRARCEVQGPGPGCIQCTRSKLKCAFTGLQSGQPEGFRRDSAQYAKYLEDRCRRLESLLKATGILQESDITDTLSDSEDADVKDESLDGAQRPRSPGHSSNYSCNSQASGQVDGARFEGDIEAAPIFKSHDSDETRYFGRSCSLSIFSRTGIQWIKEKTGETAFLNIMSPNSTEDDPWNLWRPDVFHDLFASQVYKPLPSRAEVFSLIKDYFRTANRLFPLYHEASFMKMVEWQYTQQTCDDAARWASINMVICLAYEYRFSNNMKPEKDREKARLYFKNAISVFTELSLRRTDLLSVQAMLSMAFFLRGNSGSQYSLPFVTAAMRTCQRMGLHRDIPRPDLTPAQQEQRRRVFWVAFLVDQSSCLRAGSAPCQHPDDFNVPLPSELEGDDDPEVCSNLSFFRQLCRMCVIKSHIYCRLYSAKALRRDPKEIYQIVQELHADLIEWEKDYPLEEPPRLQQSETDFLFGFASLGLHFIYYNALIMIHRIPLLLNYYVPDRDDKPEIKALRAAQTAESARICVGAARSTLKLINNMPWGDMAWIRSLLYYVFLAAATLFSNIIRDTHNPGNREDIRAISMVSNFFSSLAPGDGTGNCAVFMTRVCNSLERIARMAVERDEKGARSPDIKDKEHLSSAKKQASRSARSRDRRKPPPRQSSLPSYRDGAPHSHSSKDNSHTGMRSITLPSSHFTDNGIPENLADLPPINSSGYVVPLGLMENDNLSPSLAPQPTATTVSAIPADYPAGLGLSLEATAPQDFQSPPTMSPWEQLQHTNPATSASHSPFSQDSGNGQPNGPMFPESWQVPLTAHWQFGDNPWAALLPTVAASGYGEEIQMPSLSAESFFQPSAAPVDPVVLGPEQLASGSNDIMYNPMPPNQGQAPNQGGQFDPPYMPNGYLGLGLF